MKRMLLRRRTPSRPAPIHSLSWKKLPESENDTMFGIPHVAPPSALRNTVGPRCHCRDAQSSVERLRMRGLPVTAASCAAVPPAEAMEIQVTAHKWACALLGLKMRAAAPELRAAAVGFGFSQR